MDQITLSEELTRTKLLTGCNCSNTPQSPWLIVATDRLVLQESILNHYRLLGCSHHVNTTIRWINFPGIQKICWEVGKAGSIYRLYASKHMYMTPYSYVLKWKLQNSVWYVSVAVYVWIWIRWMWDHVQFNWSFWLIDFTKGQEESCPSLQIINLLNTNLICLSSIYFSGACFWVKI